MDDLDDTTLSVLQAADVDEGVLKTLSRDDLLDLLPGPQNFLRRKKLWDHIHPKVQSENAVREAIDQPSMLPSQPSTHAMLPSLPSQPSTSAMWPSPPRTSTPKSHHQKTVKMPDPPEYVVYTDSELDLVRSQYFELLRSGKGSQCKMSKDLFCRLIRNTVTSMVAIFRASSSCQEQLYPSKREIQAVAEKIVDYYPMLQDSSNTPYLTVYSKMYKRIQNIKSPRKRQGQMPQRGVPKKRSLLESSLEDDSDASTNLSVASTVILPDSDDNDAELSQDQDSRKTQARHYQTLQTMYSKPKSKPNGSDVAQILDLEFEARRAFIDSDATKEEDKAAKIMDAYPCFRDPRHAVDELGRILGGANSKYIDDTKKRWQTFCTNVQFYGLWKKVLKPPIPVDMAGVGPRGHARSLQIHLFPYKVNGKRRQTTFCRSSDFTIALLKALPSLFPSPTPPPKRLGGASEALIHVLEKNEDPNKYLEKRQLSSPVLLYDGSTCILAIGNYPKGTSTVSCLLIGGRGFRRGLPLPPVSLVVDGASGSLVSIRHSVRGILTVDGFGRRPSSYSSRCSVIWFCRMKGGSVCCPWTRLGWPPGLGYTRPGVHPAWGTPGLGYTRPGVHPAWGTPGLGYTRPGVVSS
ncbi:unnamed protein product [Arctogadus glacialis]